MARVAVLFRTHRLTQGILAEFSKLQATSGVDSYILLDNDKCPLAKLPQNESLTRSCLIAHEVEGGALPVFLTSQEQFDALGLPALSHEPKPSLAGIKWFNGDYPAYAFRQVMTEYDFYWMLDYDVFFNGSTYAPFFGQYAANSADFLAAGLHAASEDWMWSSHTGWAYAASERLLAFFPAVRFSAALLDALLLRRRAYGALFAQAPMPKQWLSVELFVPTETEKLGFQHGKLENLGIFHCQESLDLGDERIFMQPDNKLYHPVKGDFVSRLRRNEKRVAELEREIQTLRAQNAALLAARSKTH